MKPAPLLLAAALLLVPVLATAQNGTPVPVNVFTKASPGAAAAGNANPAFLSFAVATLDGYPVPDLGGLVADGTPIPADGNPIPADGTPLPASAFFIDPRIRLLGPGPYPPPVIKEIRNHDCGAYTLTVEPPANSTWTSGDYHYVLRVSDTYRGFSRSGLALGVLTIP